MRSIFLVYCLQTIFNTVRSVVELAQDVCTTEPPYPENASPIVVDFIKHCLIKSREARPQASHMLQVRSGALVGANAYCGTGGVRVFMVSPTYVAAPSGTGSRCSHRRTARAMVCNCSKINLGFNMV